MQTTTAKLTKATFFIYLSSVNFDLFQSLNKLIVCLIKVVFLMVKPVTTAD